MSTIPGVPGYPEPKAKRTHARRSCDVCKVRKTRCELPDLEVPSGSTPLPEDKACHRCRVLALPCIVNDVGRAGKKRKGDVPNGLSGSTMEMGLAQAGVGAGDGDGSGTPRSASGPSGSRTGDGKKGGGGGGGRKGRQGANGRDEVDHDLNVLHSLHPSLLWTEGATATPRLYVDDPFFHSPRSVPAERAVETTAQHSLKLHGRPLELVSAMLRTAYAKSHGQAGRSEVIYEPTDWDALLDASMRTQLQDMGYTQLRTFHPYLDPFHAQFDRLGSSSACNDQLLLSLIIYLCTFPLPPSSAVTQIRAHLRPKIAYLRDRVLLTAPQAFSTIHALDLLCTHGPLGVVPLQLADLSDLNAARGQLAILQSVGTGLGFKRLFNTFMMLGRDHNWISSDTWLYISVAATELAAALEDEVSRAPPSLADVRPLTSGWMEEGGERLWIDGLGKLEPADLVGRLALCDRLNRMAEVVDALDRLRGIMESVSADVTFNAVDAIQAEVNGFQANMELCDARYAAIMAILTPHTRMIESGYQTYRSLRRRHESLKILGVSIRCLTALSFIPGHADAAPDLPTDIMPHHRIKYAMDRAHVGGDIMAAVTRSTPSAMLIWRLGPERMNIAAEVLTDFGVLDKKVIPQPRPEIGMARGDMVPLHEMCAIGVEAAKILMESKAGKMAMLRNNPELAPYVMAEPEWDRDLKRAISVLRRVDLLSTPFGGEGSAAGGVGVGVGKNGRHAGNGKMVKPGEGETVSNGMSNLLGSMSRMAEMWVREGALGAPQDQDHSRGQNQSHGGGPGPSTLAQIGGAAAASSQPGADMGMTSSQGGRMSSHSHGDSGPLPSAGLDMGMSGEGYDDLASVLGQHGDMLAQHHHQPQHHHHHSHSHSHAPNDHDHGQGDGPGGGNSGYNVYDAHLGPSDGNGSGNDNGNGNGNGDSSRATSHAIVNAAANANANASTDSAFTHGPVHDHSAHMGMSHSGDGQGRYDSQSHPPFVPQSHTQTLTQTQTQYPPQHQHQGGGEYDYQTIDNHENGNNNAGAASANANANDGHRQQAKYYTATPHLGIRYTPGPAPIPQDPQQQQQQHGQYDQGNRHLPPQAQYSSSLDAPTLHSAHQQQQQQYHHGPPQQQHQHQQHQQQPEYDQTAYPTPLDLLIGQMFNYASYAPVPPAGQGGGQR